jgi:hypothetical protein
MPFASQSQWNVIFKFVNRINKAACNSTQACICTRSLRFKCPILFWHANVTQDAFLLKFLAAHITNICYFPWVNIPCESYCGVDGHPEGSGIESLPKYLLFSGIFFYFPQMLSFTFFFNSTFKPFYHFVPHKNCC